MRMSLTEGQNDQLEEHCLTRLDRNNHLLRLPLKPKDTRTIEGEDPLLRQ